MDMLALTLSANHAINYDGIISTPFPWLSGRSLLRMALPMDLRPLACGISLADRKFWVLGMK